MRHRVDPLRVLFMLVSFLMNCEAARHNQHAVRKQQQSEMSADAQEQLMRVHLAWALLAVTMILPFAITTEEKRLRTQVRMLSLCGVGVYLRYCYFFETLYQTMGFVANICWPDAWMSIAECLCLQQGMCWACSKTKEKLSAACARLACRPIQPQRQATEVLLLTAGPLPQTQPPQPQPPQTQPRGRSPGRGKSPRRRKRS